MPRKIPHSVTCPDCGAKFTSLAAQSIVRCADCAAANRRIVNREYVRRSRERHMGERAAETFSGNSDCANCANCANLYYCRAVVWMSPPRPLPCQADYRAPAGSLAVKVGDVYA